MPRSHEYLPLLVQRHQVLHIERVTARALQAAEPELGVRDIARVNRVHHIDRRRRRISIEPDVKGAVLEIIGTDEQLMLRRADVEAADQLDESYPGVLCLALVVAEIAREHSRTGVEGVEVDLGLAVPVELHIRECRANAPVRAELLLDLRENLAGVVPARFRSGLAHESFRRQVAE